MARSSIEKEQSLRVRVAIVNLVRAADHPMTCADLARALNENVRSIRNYCILLKEGNWLSLGPIVTSNDRSRHKAITWAIGTNEAPIPRPVKHLKPPPKKERPVDAMITSDDLAWMQKYREQLAQRYRKCGLEVPNIY